MSPKPETVTSQADALAKGSTTSADLVRTALRRAEERADLNAFVSLDSGVVLDQAKASDARRSAGKTLSAIDGVPVAIKDNYLTRDFPTTACSKALPRAANGVDATVVANLRAAGAVIFGKTNMHEWAFGATNTTSSIGPTRNPHNTDHITGGSSGGSAAAVAAGIVGAALGSDTGGSVRIPSAACGVYGFKPTYGRASRHGVLPLSWSLDAPGPIARSLDDLALLLPFFLGSDPKDTATAQATPFEKQSAPDTPIILNLVGEGLERSEEVDLAVRTALNRGGASMKDTTIPHMRSFFAAWEAILHVEASSYHENLLADAPAAFTSVTRAHLEAGRQITALQAMHAQKLRACFMELLLNGLGEWDALALPTLPVPAPKHGQDRQSFGGRDVTTQDSMTWFCWPGNLAGLPCISLPVDTSTNGLPISMMLMGRPGKDESLLEIAYQFDNVR